MDIQVLLWLQGIREALGPAAATVANAVTTLGSGTVAVLVIALVYWCLDKALGEELAVSVAVGSVVGQALKGAVCCYRPWVRDARVRPAAQALPSATGYSFPSGHSQSAASLYGGIAASSRTRRGAVKGVCVALVVAVPLTRCFLGVHTPQDVLAGVALGLASVWASRRALRWAKGRPAREALLSCVGIGLSLALVAFGSLRSYPSGVVCGRLVADPAEAVLDCWRCAGLLVGVSAALPLEHRLVGFTCEGIGLRERVWRVVVGAAIAAAVMLRVRPVLLLALGGYVGRFASHALLAFACLFLAPAAFRAIERPQKGHKA